MHRTRVKVCGIGHAEDATAAARAGADAIGLVFHTAAPRNVSVQRAGEIIAKLPPFVTPVGLFFDADAGRIREIARTLPLRTIQLHGNEPPELVAELRELTILKALRVDATEFAGQLENWRGAIKKLRLGNLQGFVLETAGVDGGSGVANDWEAVRRHRQRGDFIGLPPIIAAGGLRPETVAGVIAAVRPWAVDVSSGVESDPGHKSPQKIESFVRAVRGTDQD